MNGDVNENRKLFWKELSNGKGGKVEICSRIKDGNGENCYTFHPAHRFRDVVEHRYHVGGKENMGRKRFRSNTGRGRTWIRKRSRYILLGQEFSL